MRRVAMFVLAGLLVLAVASPAWAATAEPGDRSLVVLTGDALVPAGEVVDAVVVFDGAVVIEGRVRDAVVAFHGPVTIAETARVGKAVVVFDGTLTVEAGAVVAGDVYADDRQISPDATVEGTVSSLARFTVGFGWAAVIVGFLFWLSVAISILVLGLLLLWWAPRAADAVAAASTSALGPSIGWGLLVAFGLPIAAVLAMATLVALPLGIVVLLALAFLFAIGQTAGAWLLGRRIMSTASRAAAFLVGWAIVSGLGLIPLVGGLAWFAATVVGLGAIAVAVARARRGGSVPDATPPMPA